MMGYNSRSWIERSLISALNQNHPNFDVIAIDAETNDGTYEYLKTMEEDHSSLSVVRNDPRQYQVQNVYDGVRLAKDNSIVVTLDFDDALCHNMVLSTLDKYYTEDIWMTYGSMVQSGREGVVGFDRYPDGIIKSNSYRDVDWRATHLRTFRKELAVKIKEEDFKDDNGNWITVAGDLAFMWPMLEMCCGKFAYIPEPLYFYNRENELSEFRTSVPLVLETEKMIRKKRRYEPIDCLDKS